MSRLPTKVEKGVAVWAAAQAIANEIMKLKLNRDEAYVDRIKREFNLRGHEQARAVFDSNPTYWRKLYGSDPLNSPHHPARRRVVCCHHLQAIVATYISPLSQWTPACGARSGPVNSCQIRLSRRDRSTRRAR